MIWSRFRNRKWLKKPYKWTNKNEREFNKDLYQTKCQDLLLETTTRSLSSKETYDKIISNNNNCINKLQHNSVKICYSDETRECRRAYKKAINDLKDSDTQINLDKLLNAKRNLNRKIRKEKRKMRLAKLEELEDAKMENDHKKYWQLINEKRKKVEKSKKSTLTANDFKQKLTENNSKTLGITPDDRDVHTFPSQKPNTNQSLILDEDIAKIEIENCLKDTHNSKCSGPDGLVYETLKNNKEESISIYLHLFNKILDGDFIPWDYSWITPIFKSGNINEAISYRCINLASALEKLLTKIINERLNVWLEANNVIHYSQIGFRKGHSTLDNILIFREINKVYNNMKSPLYLCFIDLSKAFDSIPKHKLVERLNEMLPNSRILKLIKHLINDKSYRILYDGQESELFTLNNGIPQGDSLSPTLFCLYMNRMYQILDDNLDSLDPINIGSNKLCAIGYADDILLYSESQQGLLKQIQIVHEFCNASGLHINYSKTKIMTRNTKNIFSHVNMKINDTMIRIEVVQEYKYLGLLIAKNDRRHIEYLQKKGKKSSFVTSKALKEFGKINGKMLKDTFEILTLSQMKYGGEFIFSNKLNELNKVQLQFYKKFYYLKPSTANYCIYGEFGVKSFEYHFYKAAIRFWIRIISSKRQNLTWKFYEHIMSNLHDATCTNTWTHHIKKLLFTLNLQQLWFNQNECDKNSYIRIVNERLHNFFREEWINSAKISHKGLYYIEMCRFDNNLKPYLNMMSDISEETSIMLKFRTGHHKLMAEIGRYGNRLEYEECYCPFCPERIEDIYHFLVECPNYNYLREDIIPEFIDISRAEFYGIFDTNLGSRIKSVAKFIKSVNEERLIMHC